jgi:hypothetical protein
LRPAALITLAQTWVSSASCLAKTSGGVEPLTEKPSASLRHFRKSEHRIGLLVEQRNDVRRRAGRNENAFPGLAVETRIASFGNGRHIGQRFRSGLAHGREHADLSAWHQRRRSREPGKSDLRVAGEHRLRCRAGAAVRHMHDVEIERLAETLAEQMRGRSDPGGSVAEFARRRAHQRHQLGHRLCRHFFGIDRKCSRKARGERDRSQILHRIVGHRLIEQWIDDLIIGVDENGVTVGRGMRGFLGANIAAGADNILDKELLTEMLREPFRQQPGKDIARSAGTKSDDDAHRVRRIGLGLRDARRCREDRSGASRSENVATGKMHRHLLDEFTSADPTCRSP